MLFPNSIEFHCITSTRKGFILGGTKGIISAYELGNFE